MFLNKRTYSNKNYIIKGLITAILFSSFIYLKHFDIQYRILDTIFGLLALYLVLTISKKSLAICGFFIGVLWCNWMAYSLEYYDLVYLTPVLIIGIGLVYALIFFIIGLFNYTLIRAILLFAFSFLTPFNFDWVKPELIFINSYIGIQKYEFAYVLVALVLLIELKKLRFLAIFPLIATLNSETNFHTEMPDIKIQMAQMDIPQELKWKKYYKNTLISKNFNLINKAIQDKKELIILPESIFPTALNLDTNILEELKKLSQKIDIVVGSLYVQDKQIYNATYFVSKGEVQIAQKVVLVPFGEEIPLPKFIKDWINNTFYNGAKDLVKADKPTDFIIKNIKFRNAICYEATSDKIYQNLGNTKYIIATSNNAWFKGSIEPTLQNLLLKYYSNIYKVVIFNVANASENSIIKPTKYVLALQ